MYEDLYLPEFKKALKKYKHWKGRIGKKVKSILKDPYYNSEPLKYEMEGLRSRNFDKNFRFIYVVCEECKEKNLQTEMSNKYCYKDNIECVSIPDKTVIFGTFSKHDDAYHF
ncbi:unnamed protein product [marine sediment metagenome]|uniref:Uncharacterized protein n=1 Tax=marine sediment metagenome TaxID=412755 RepID=X1M384_9ZZZZ